MKLTIKKLKQLIKEELKETWRSQYRKSAEREKEINYRARPVPHRVNKRSWQKYVEPTLEQLIAADPDNLLADELLGFMRHILPHEYEQIIADLQTYGIDSTDFETNAKALVNWQAEYR